MASLDLIHIDKSFESTHILHDISISLQNGEFLVLVGPSGCGKSTLMNVIAGLEEPTAGQVQLDSADITHRAPAERDISMVFQSYALYPNMTVAQNIAFPLEMRKVPRAHRQERVLQVAKLLQIEYLLDRKPRQLSGGQRQRVAIGRALAREPKLYLFDEPLSNLDAQLRIDMRIELKKLHQRLKATIVYVTHDQIEAMTLATRIAVMKNGYLQQLGTPQEVYDEPSNTFVAGFMGSPRMNLTTVEIAQTEQGLSLIFPLQKHTQIPLPERFNFLRNHVGKQVIVGIRAEAINSTETSLQPHGNVATSLLWKTQAQIEVMEPTGSETLAILKLGGVEFSAKLPANTTLGLGNQAEFQISLEKLVFFDKDSENRIL